MRAFIIAPADVHAQLLGRNVGGCGIERFDIGFRDLEEVFFRHVLISGVTGHREVGAVELQIEAGGCDGLIFWAHRGDEIGQIGFMARIILVGLEGGDEAGGGRVHEAGHGLARHGFLEAADILMAGLKIDELYFANAGRADKFLIAHDGGQLFAKLGQGREVERGFARHVATKARQPFGDVGRITDLAEFAIAGDGDAGVHLLDDSVIHGALNDSIKLSHVISFAMVAG